MKTSRNEREQMLVRAREIRVATSDDGSRTVTGHAIVYNSRSVDLGGFTEVMAPGALTRTLRDNPDVLCLRDHDSSLLLGRTISGTLTLSEDATGLRFDCKLPDTSAARDLAASLERGDIDACSFGFCAVNDTWTEDAQGNIVRTLLDVDLFEVSVVSFPAYAATSASLRSAPPEIRSAITARAEHRDADETDAANEAGCTCSCAQCRSNACGICSNDDCDDENCACPDDDAVEEDSVRTWRERAELRVKLHEHSL